MNILVTGATGVVGRRLVPLLRDAGHAVTAVARSSAGREQISKHGATAIELDLFDPAAVRRAVAGHDAVVNLATHIPPPSRIFLPWAWRENDRLRHEASAIVAHACMSANVPRLVQESFAPVYPDCGDRWIDETTKIEPVKYNRTVADAEASVDRFSRSGRTGVTLRFGGFYGPDAAQTIEMIKFIKRGWAPLPGPPEAFISSISHDDAASAAASAVTLPAGVYNVVDDEPVTHRAFMDTLAEALHVPAPKLPPTWVTPLFGSLGEMAARSLRMSNKKLRTASGWAPKLASVRDAWGPLVAQLGA